MYAACATNGANASHEAAVTPDAGGMRDLLESIRRSITVSATAMRNGSIRRAMVAYLAFNTVEMASWTTILVFAYGATGPGSVGLVAILQLIPSAVAAPLLANIGDRFPRASVLLGWFSRSHSCSLRRASPSSSARRRSSSTSSLRSRRSR